MRQLFNELRRRNVFKAAVSYVVIAWALLQAADIIFPLLDVPDSVLRIIFFIMLIGFPAWVIFAYVYELTPEGFRKTEDVVPEESITTQTSRKLSVYIISGLLVAVVLLLADKVVSMLGAASPPKAIAVLSFENLADSTEAYFARGITEDILTSISRTSDIPILSRFTVRDYDKKGKSPKQIGEELNVGYLLVGTIDRRGNNVRIGCQLIDTKTGLETWAQSFDRSINDVFAVQRDLAQQVALFLHAKLSEPADRQNPTQSVTAYNYYLKGREEYYHLGGSSNDLAIEHFKKAIALDPNFGLGFAGLADAYCQSVMRYGRRAMTYLDTAKNLAERSVTLNPAIPESWKALGLVNYYKGKYNEAAEAYVKALEVDPSHEPAIGNLAMIYRYQGRIDEAIKLYRKSVAINPLRSTEYANLSSAYRMLGLYPEAVQSAQHAVSLDSTIYNLYLLAFAHVARGDRDGALNCVPAIIASEPSSPVAFENAGEITCYLDPVSAKKYFNRALRSEQFDPEIQWTTLVYLGYILWDEGKRDSANLLFDKGLSIHVRDANAGSQDVYQYICIAQIHTIRGNIPEALVWLRKVADMGFVDYAIFSFDRSWDPIRSNEEFRNIVKEITMRAEGVRKRVE